MEKKVKGAREGETARGEDKTHITLRDDVWHPSLSLKGTVIETSLFPSCLRAFVVKF
jgi:hypothetical protein